MSITERIKQIVADQLGVDLSDVVPDASFVDDLGADSLDRVELIMAMEEEFDIKVDDQDAEKIKTVGQLIDFIVNLKKK